MPRRRRQLASRVQRRGMLLGLAVFASGTGATLLFERDASAQALLERFDPAERGSRFFVADSLELDGSLRLATGVVTSYGTQLKTFQRAAGAAGAAATEQTDLVAHSVWIHPGASLVLAPGARFAFDVPVALQSGSDVVLDRKLYFAPASPRLGDVRASFDLRLAGTNRHDVDGAVLAAGVVAWLPTGSSADYTSDEFARFGVRVATSVRQGPILAAARLGYMYRRDDLEPFGRVSLGSEANGVLALGYRNAPVVIGPEVHGTTVLKDAFKRRTTPVEVLVGGHLTLADVQIGLGVGSTLVSGLGAPLFRGVVSLEYTPSPETARDRDHDGVLDADDMCPDVPGLKIAALGAVGCPAAPHDGDGDGIVDTEDACPDLPGMRSREAMTHGCPDADHDGVPDPLDACPSVSGARSVLPRFDGCPPDADGDGVPDERDACPDEPGVASDDPDKNGCAPPPPPPPDGDGDGISDADDACPDVGGPKATLASVNGCPIARPDASTALQLRSESDALLTRFAAGLIANPELRVVVVVVVVSAANPGANAGAKADAKADAKRAQAQAHAQAQAQKKAIVDRLVDLGVARTRFDGGRSKGAAAKKQVELRVLPVPSGPR